jgi:hypothetical protein
MANGNKPTPGNYAVGYGKPPEQNRFRPGRSGNPAGRTKGVRNLKTDVVSTLGARIKIKEGGRMRTKSTQQAALMLLREKALHGDPRALNTLLDLAARFNNEALEKEVKQPLAADDQAILDAYRADCASGGPAEKSNSRKFPKKQLDHSK